MSKEIIIPRKGGRVPQPKKPKRREIPSEYFNAFWSSDPPKNTGRGSLSVLKAARRKTHGGTAV